MIRINLLPTRDAPRRQAVVVQLVAFGVLLLSVTIVLIAIDAFQRDKIDKQRITNEQVQNRIESIQTQIRDHDQIRARIEEIEGKQNIIDELQSGRTGPVFVMVELSRILSREGAPSINHDRYMELVRRSPGQAYDPNWDGRRLWVNIFRESNRAVEFVGEAISHEDVAELLRRLGLSDYFHQVTLLNTRTAGDLNREASEMSVNFSIRCRLRYGGLPSPEDTQQAPSIAGS